MTPEEMVECAKSLLLSTKRDGVERLVQWLVQDTDYFTAPASSRFHLNREHGLLQHHLNVYKVMARKNVEFKLNIRQESIIIVALLHDLCKLRLYERQPDGSYRTNTVVFNKGHGKQSIEHVKPFLHLLPHEEAMIRYHMGTWSMRENGEPPGPMHEYAAEELHRAIKEHRCVQVFASADMEATMMEDAK